MISTIVQLAPECALFALITLLFIQSTAKSFISLPLRCWIPAGAALVLLVSALSLGQTGVFFSGVYANSALSQFFKLAVAIGFLFVALNATRQPTLDSEEAPDYFLFMALSAFGLMLLASAVELVTLLLALEISSFSLYVLIPLREKTLESAEAGVKYILFGAASTALSLYGLSLIIAAQHSTYIIDLVQKDWSFAASPQAAAGLLLFLCGMFYKLALFPFHFWCPDVYQGASNETAAFVATLPKLGAVVILIRLSGCLHPGEGVTTAIAVFGGISMTFGNLCALAQKDIKRLLGFSSVAHAGYITVGLVVGTSQGLAAAAFYALAYVIMNILCFWVVSRVSTDGRNLELKDLNGLHKKQPVLAFALAVGAFALVGLPPTLGFMGKLFLISAAWNNGYNWLVILLVLNSAIAIYYYLSLVRHAYTEESADEASAPEAGHASAPAAEPAAVPVAAPSVTPDVSVFASLGALILAGIALLLGIVPSPLFDLAVQAGDKLY